MLLVIFFHLQTQMPVVMIKVKSRWIPNINKAFVTKYEDKKYRENYCNSCVKYFTKVLIIVNKCYCQVVGHILY